MMTGAKEATAAVYLGPEVMEIQRLPLPDLRAGDVLVEVLLCGVDGSEVAMLRGSRDYLNARVPVIFGDEIVGQVTAIGEAAAASRGLSVGDRVVVESRWPCPEGCYSCSIGQYYTCENRGVTVGYGMISAKKAPGLWGGYATHVFVPEYAIVHRVPETLPDRTALVACSPLANGISWMDSANPEPGQRAAIIGPGPQGLSCALAARDLNVEPVVIGLSRDVERLAIARALGSHTFEITQDLLALPADEIAAAITTTFGPIDIVVDVSASAPAKDLAVAVLRQRGTFVSSSVPTPPTQPFNWRTLLFKEATIIGRVSHPGVVERGFALAERLLHDGTDVGRWITHVFPLAEAEKAIRTAAYETNEYPIKVALNPRSK